MRKMSAFLELPGEPAVREVQVILTGKRRAVIENYRNIQSYTREEILILTPSGRLVIRGKNLVIPCYTTLEDVYKRQVRKRKKRDHQIHSPSRTIQL